MIGICKRFSIRPGCALAGLALTLNSTAQAQEPGQPPGRDHTSSRFGVVEACHRPNGPLEPGVGWERIVFEWPQSQPTSPDEFDTNTVPETRLLDAQAVWIAAGGRTWTLR